MPYDLTTSPTHLFVSGDVPDTASSSILRSFAYDEHVGTFAPVGDLSVPRVPRGYLGMAWAADMVFGQDGTTINRINVEDPSAMTFVSSILNARLSDARVTKRGVWTLHSGFGLSRLERLCCRVTLAAWSPYRDGQRHLQIHHHAEEATPVLEFEGARDPRNIAIGLDTVIAEYPGEVEVHVLSTNEKPVLEIKTLPSNCVNCSLLGVRDLEEGGLAVLEGIFVDQNAVVRSLDLWSPDPAALERWSVAVGHPVTKMLAVDDAIVVVGQLERAPTPPRWRSKLSVIGPLYEGGPQGILGTLEVPLTVWKMKLLDTRSLVIFGSVRADDGSVESRRIDLYDIGSPVVPVH